MLGESRQSRTSRAWRTAKGGLNWLAERPLVSGTIFVLAASLWWGLWFALAADSDVTARDNVALAANISQVVGVVLAIGLAFLALADFHRSIRRPAMWADFEWLPVVTWEHGPVAIWQLMLKNSGRNTAYWAFSLRFESAYRIVPHLVTNEAPSEPNAGPWLERGFNAPYLLTVVSKGFSLEGTSNGTLNIYDSQGELVATPAVWIPTPAEYPVAWHCTVTVRAEGMREPFTRRVFMMLVDESTIAWSYSSEVSRLRLYARAALARGKRALRWRRRTEHR